MKGKGSKKIGHVCDVKDGVSKSMSKAWATGKRKGDGRNSGPGGSGKSKKKGY